MWRKHHVKHLSFWWGDVNKKSYRDNIYINLHYIFNIQSMFLCRHQFHDKTIMLPPSVSVNIS